jgi:hypothetical protein
MKKLFIVPYCICPKVVKTCSTSGPETVTTFGIFPGAALYPAESPEEARRFTEEDIKPKPGYTIFIGQVGEVPDGELLRALAVIETGKTEDSYPEIIGD